MSIFSDLISEGLEVYMDDFTPYNDDFDQALNNLEKVMERCITTRLCLSREKCHMMMTEGVVLGNYIYVNGIRVDLAKIEVILNLPTPHTQTEVHSFLGASGYYRRFMPNFSKTTAPLHEAILNLPTPHTQTEVHSFLGASGYYRRFMPNFSKTTAPLHALTGNVEFQWSDKCDVDFAGLKKLISTVPVLRGPNWKIPFQFH
jgi:hypothetical protein